MKQWEKLTAWLVVFALVAGLVGGSAFVQVSAAEENSDFAYAVNEDGTATITEVKTNAADVIVPAVIDGHTVTAIGSHTSEWSTTPAGAFESKWQAVNVYLPDTITSFADRAFASCAIEHIYRYDPAQISAEDIVSSMLADLGIEGVQIEDKIPLTQSDKEQMFVDILPDMPEDDGCAYLTFYLDEEVDKHEMLLKVRQELEEMRSYLNVGDCTIEESQTEDVDWVNNWKQYFHQFYIDDILVIPSWENVEAKDSDKMVIHIDPGTAFGTGMHETTQLCIRQLKKYVTEDTEILDVGCGSGILGMLALKFGAKHSVGTDLDPCAIDATYENMDNNGISRDQYEVMIGNIIDDKEVQDKVGYEKYDIVAANILADVLVPLTPVIIHQLKKGGIYITSGIIEDKEEVVVEAVKKAGLEVLEVNHQGEWVSVTARKN